MGKRTLYGLIGALLATMSLGILSFVGLGIFFYKRKKYKHVVLAAITVAFFILLLIVSNIDASSQQKEQRPLLEQTIKSNLFSIHYSPLEILTIEQINKVVQENLKDEINFEELTADEQKKFQNIVKTYYSLYANHYASKRHSSAKFLIPHTEIDKLDNTVSSFCSAYIERKYPESDVLSFLYVVFALLYIFSIPYTAYCFAKYITTPAVAQPKGPPVKKQEEVNDVVDPDWVTNKQKPTFREDSEATSVRIVVKINSASLTEIKDSLGVNSIHAQIIARERTEKGCYVDFADFVQRMRGILSERICNGFKDRLDFSVENDNQRRGRVVDF